LFLPLFCVCFVFVLLYSIMWFSNSKENFNVQYILTCMTGFEKKCQIWGWGLFIISAVFFMAAAVRAGDWLGFMGSLFFLVACFVFLVPVLRR